MLFTQFSKIVTRVYNTVNRHNNSSIQHLNAPKEEKLFLKPPGNKTMECIDIILT